MTRPAARAPVSRPDWAPTPALTGTVATVAVLLPLAVIVRRVDLVVIAGTLLAGALGPLLLAPGRRARAEVRLSANARTALEGQAVVAHVTIAGGAGADVARVQVRHTGRVTVDGADERCVHLDAIGNRDLDVRFIAERWGREDLGPVEMSVFAAHGMLRHRRLATGARQLATLPLREVFSGTDLVPHAEGVVGSHRSRRPGDGSELATIRPFTTGDRLRRITWPVSTRAGSLHVVATLAERDTVVTLVLDNAAEVPGADGDGSLDIAVRAAATIGEHYLRQGDRVGLIDLGSTLRPVRAAGGRAHLLRLLDVLLDTEQRRTGREAEIERLLMAAPPRSLIVVFSTLLDQRAAAQAAVAARTGHPVVIVDTVPARPDIPPRSDWTPLAWRLALLHRAATSDRLSELGVPVVAWRGPGSLDEVLRDLSRTAAAPKAIR